MMMGGANILHELYGSALLQTSASPEAPSQTATTAPASEIICVDVDSPALAGEAAKADTEHAEAGVPARTGVRRVAAKRRRGCLKPMASGQGKKGKRKLEHSAVSDIEFKFAETPSVNAMYIPLPDGAGGSQPKPALKQGSKTPKPRRRPEPRPVLVPLAPQYKASSSLLNSDIPGCWLLPKRDEQWCKTLIAKGKSSIGAKWGVQPLLWKEFAHRIQVVFNRAIHSARCRSSPLKAASTAQESFALIDSDAEDDVKLDDSGHSDDGKDDSTRLRAHWAVKFAKVPTLDVKINGTKLTVLNLKRPLAIQMSPNLGEVLADIIHQVLKEKHNRKTTQIQRTPAKFSFTQADTDLSVPGAVVWNAVQRVYHVYVKTKKTANATAGKAPGWKPMGKAQRRRQDLDGFPFRPVPETLIGDEFQKARIELFRRAIQTWNEVDESERARIECPPGQAESQ